MWYFKEAAKKVSTVTTAAYNYSKKLIITEKSQNQKLIDIAIDSKSDVPSTTNLDKLVEVSYNVETFQELNNLIYQKLRVFLYNQDAAKKTLNLLITVNYLLKHGPSGFIDQFRNQLKIFINYQKLQKRIIYKSPFDIDKQRYFEQIIDKIIGRASHIISLLNDKVKLHKQRDLAMLVKQKLRVYEKKKLEQNKQLIKSLQKQQLVLKKSGSNIHDYFENYFWRYVDNIDNKLENISQRIMKKMDEMLKRRQQQQIIELNLKNQKLQKILDEGMGIKDNKQRECNKKEEIQRIIDDKEVNQDFLKQLQKQIGDIQIKNEDLINLQENIKKFNIQENVSLL